MPRFATIRLWFTVALALCSALATAQFSPEPQAALADEVGQLRAVQVGAVTNNPPSEVELLGACLGITGTPFGYLDTNLDGRPDILRVFGADRATKEQWQQVGSRLLGPLRERAVLRAQGEVAQVVMTHTAVENGLLDTFSADLSSVDMTSSSREQIRTTANASLRGATISGQRIVSLDNDEGVCVIVRYDVPVDGNILPQGEVVPGTPRSGPDQGADGSPGHPLPPPGVAGDF